MKRSIVLSFLLITETFFLSSYSPEPSADKSDIQGIWLRKTDNLMIKVTTETSDKLHSFIIQEGNEKFPCDVSGIPIYKNIVKKKENLWACDFLVVTLGRCSTDYEEGMIRITKDGDMEITCPGFSKKIYARLNPRYNPSAQPG